MALSWRHAVQLGIVLGAFALWEAVVAFDLVDSRTLPPPSEVAAHFAIMIANPDTLYHLWITSAQVFLAFVLVAPIGVALGLLLGESDYLGRAFKPFFYFVASVPKSVFLPVFILSFGIGFTQKVAFGMFFSIFVVVRDLLSSPARGASDLVKMARSCGAKRWELYRQVYLPSMFPVIVEGLRLGMIFNITGVLFAEMYVSRAGLGHLVAQWGMRFEMANLFAGILLAALLSIFVNESLRWYERKIGSWRG